MELYVASFKVYYGRVLALYFQQFSSASKNRKQV